MKKKVGIVALAALAASASASFAGINPQTGIVGSYHDMNYYMSIKKTGTPDKYQRVCIFCHTPHNAAVADPVAGSNTSLPLWNHNFPDTTKYTSYQWATPSNYSLTINDPFVGPSRLCMSCHDGSIAIDQHGPTASSTAAPSTGSLLITGARAIGHAAGNVADTHPIGFSYDDAVKARNISNTVNGVTTSIQELAPLTNTFATAVGDVTSTNPDARVVRGSAKTIQSVTYGANHIMTCASCHEVHNKQNSLQDAASDGSTPNFFLYAKESNSLICLSCHIK